MESAAVSRVPSGLRFATTSRLDRDMHARADATGDSAASWPARAARAGGRDLAAEAEDGSYDLGGALVV